MIAACVAVAGFTSCSSDDEPVNAYNSTTSESSGETPIMLSMSKAGMEVTTRGTGAVGDTDNKWRGEKLNVYMLDKSSFELAVGYDGTPLFENAEITAPSSTDSDNTFADYGLPKYYPMSGNFNFFIYHADDANTVAPSLNSTGDQYVLPITIDGSQDLMIAKADMPTAQKNAFATSVGTENAERYYSAYSARRKIGFDGNENEIGIQPHFQLQHLLSRLVFYVEPTSKGVSDKAQDSEGRKTGVTIESIEILNVNTKAEFIVAWKGATPTNYLIVDETSKSDIALQEKVAGQTEAHTLVPFTPLQPIWDETNNCGLSTRVGESLMLFPASEYKLKINMTQTPHYDENGAPEIVRFTHYQTLKVPGVSTKFEAGKQYKVLFKVYGAEKNIIDLELTPWEDGDVIEAEFDKREEE